MNNTEIAAQLKNAELQAVKNFGPVVSQEVVEGFGTVRTHRNGSKSGLIWNKRMGAYSHVTGC